MAGNEVRLPGITLPADWFAMLLSLDDATLSALIRAAIRYSNFDGPDGQDGQDGRAGTEAMGLKAKAAPLWLIMRAEIDRQIAKRERVIAGTRKAINARWERRKAASSSSADTNVYERIRTNTNVYERIRTYDGENSETDAAGNSGADAADPSSKPAADTNGYERIRTYTNVSTRKAGARGEVYHYTVPSSLSVKENVQEKAGSSSAKAAEDKHGRKKPEKRERIVRILMHYIRRYYHRRKTTAWSSKEMSQLRKIAARPEAVREMIIIGRAYRSDYRYARHDIITLLNNWTTELDRASIFNRDNRGRSLSHGGRIEQRYGMQ